MTVENMIKLGLIKDTTTVIIRGKDLRPRAKGRWFEDHVLAFVSCEVECFTWQDDDRFYIDLKEVEGDD